jgi:hypothetical protein
MLSLSELQIAHDRATIRNKIIYLSDLQAKFG